MKKRNIELIIISEFLFFILMLLWYLYLLNPSFEYTGFDILGFNNMKLIFSSLIIIVFILLGLRFKYDLFFFVYHIFLLRYLIPSFVMFVYSNNSIIPILLMCSPLISLYFFSRIKMDFNFNIAKYDLQKNNNLKIYMLLLLVLLMPFTRYLSNVNLNNLLLIDVYETRLNMREITDPLVGYLSSPLSRYLIPTLVIFALIRNKTSEKIISFLMIIFIYLTGGAVKTILFSFIVVVFFYKFSIIHKIKYFVMALNGAFIFEILYGFFTNKILLTPFLRRIFMVPVNLFEKYYTYYTNNYTYYKHTQFADFFGASPEQRNITRWFGEHVLKQAGANANVGVFVEGYFSFGIIGFLIISFLFGLFIKLYSKLFLDIRFIGLLFVFIDILMSSTLEPVFVTHGGIVFLIISLYIIPSQQRTEGAYERRIFENNNQEKWEC